MTIETLKLLQEFLSKKLKTLDPNGLNQELNYIPVKKFLTFKDSFYTA